VVAGAVLLPDMTKQDQAEQEFLGLLIIYFKGGGHEIFS